MNLIKSLKKISYRNYEIIAVDNGSTDGSQKELKKNFGEVILLENKKNLGLAEGTNVGIRKALKNNSKYVLVMNNDMVVRKDFLNILVDSMEKHPEVAVAGPKLYYMNPKDIIWCAGCDYHPWGFSPRQQGEKEKIRDKVNKVVDAIDCVLMLRSDTLKKIGLFDSDLFFIHELTGWCLRATKYKYKCLYVPNSHIWHKVSAAFEKDKRENSISTYYGSRNWLLVIKRNKPLYYFFIVLLLHTTFFATVRFYKFLKIKNSSLIKDYFIGVWHALINKTPIKLYPYGDND